MESPGLSPRADHGCPPNSGFSFPASSVRCTRCCPRPRENARNLVVCIDGTSNQYGKDNTNVVKLFTKVDLQTRCPEQHAYYSSGIGTRQKLLRALHVEDKEGIAESYDMVVALNIDKIIKDAYGWLARAYQEGDQIYLFGFSRGAYQVRVLAGMIYETGLTKFPTPEHIETAYDCYEGICSRKPQSGEMAKEFKENFSWESVRVHFVGVWDTVSSVGLIRRDVFLSMSSSAAHACHFRHALALDECRVKFMPEYFHEINSLTDGGTSKYILSSRYNKSTTSDQRMSTPSNGTDLSNDKTSDIKEVWFAGSHSDVGGTSKLGQSHHSGNVSLLWMRREAAAHGLVLEPTDIVWIPDDIDFGTSDSMTLPWKTVEYVPIRHQVSFSGLGGYARRLHRFQPRRIIPGQKVHASILYAHAYQPKATPGDGFEIPVIQSGVEDIELDEQIWETGLFDDAAAQELMEYLGSQQGVAPIHLHRLLFMLRFKEGKQCVRNVPNWESKFMKLIRGHDHAPLVRLAAMIACYETSCNHEVLPNICVPLHELSSDIFDDAKQCMANILAAHKHRDSPTMIVLIRPLIKHPTLRERFLTPDILDTFIRLIDVIIWKLEGNFGRAMDSLNCLLQCEATQQFIIGKLTDNIPQHNKSRLARILEVNDLHLLVAALRMVLILARIPEARAVCSMVIPSISELASKYEGPVGHLATEIWLSLYDPGNRDQLNISNAHVRANLASVLVHSGLERPTSVDGNNPVVNPGQQILSRLFGLDATELTSWQRELIRELKTAIEKGNVRQRTSATMTLLKLCESDVIRSQLHEIKILNIFVSQLRHKDSALLAAYALATCLNYNEMKESIKDNDDLPKHIVRMLMLDYFDDAVGPVEGFQIFGSFMQHADLREKIMDYNITEVLSIDMGKGKSKKLRTSLICLDIFHSFDPNGPWAAELVEKSLKYLRSSEWKTQKAGVTILSALARMERGVEIIQPRIHEIIGMLLPEGFLPIQPTAASPTFAGEGQPLPTTSTIESLESQAFTHKSPSWMLGPACMLRVLAQNEILCNHMRETWQYGSLKHLFLSGTLVDETDTSPWRVKTPNRADVIDMLDKMIKVVDKELPEEGVILMGSSVPHIQHWDRLVKLLGRPPAMIVGIPALLGISALAMLAGAVTAPIYASIRVYDSLKHRLADYRIDRALSNLRRHTVHPTEPQGESAALGQHDGEGSSDGQQEESSRSD